MTAARLAALRHQLREAREAAIARFRADHRADALLAALRRAADRSLRGLLRSTCPLPAGAALAAVGGYGRGELYPGSDVDLLILLPAPPDARQTQTIERLVAALWDIGLEPGHSVRTVADCQREAAADITVETALLESRWLAGSRKLMRQFQTAMQAQLDARRFFLAKRAETRARHARYQDTPYALEPHCKESPGGLRDVQVIVWLARAAGLAGDGDNRRGNCRTNQRANSHWRAIAASGLLSAEEARALRRAEQAFKRLRIELHLLAGRREDRLLFALQAELAHAYGITESNQQRASERLMQRYYWAARRVTQLNLILVQNIEERLFAGSREDAVTIDADFRSVHGRLDVSDDEAFARHPSLLLRAFLVMQQRPEITDLSAHILRAIWHHRRRIDAAFRRDPVNQQLFLQILRQPQGVARALRRMTMLNVLPRYLPAFRRIVGQMQHNLFHAYTVDQHTLIVIDYLHRFSQLQYATEQPLANELMRQFERPWLLYVAALYHDIAKGQDGDHSLLGARAVRRFARQHGLDQDDAALVEFLVREHLLMSRVAQKQDLSDPAVIHAFARTVATPRRLAALYLLTVADIRGTHPTLWNAWKDKLLADLYALARAALNETAVPEAATVLARRKQSAARLARRAGVPDAGRKRLWQQLEAEYFLRHDAAAIVWHAQSLYAAASTDTVVKARLVQHRAQNNAQHHAHHHAALQILVATPDRPDLFETLCGYFEAHGLDVQDARIHTATDSTGAGWAIDHFVALAHHLAHHDGDAPGALAARIEDDLARWLAQRPQRRAQRARALPSRQSRQFPISPSLTLQPDHHGQSRQARWRLSLTATDRPGLLHTIAQTLRAHGVNLHTAKIMTLGARVEDVFTLTGPTLTESRARAQFEAALLTKLRDDAA